MAVAYRSLGLVFVLGASARAEPTPAADTARAILAAQLQRLSDPSAMLATLAPDALILGNGSFALGRTRQASAVVAQLGTAASGLPPMSEVIDSLDAAGTREALWFSAHVDVIHSGWRGRTGPQVTSARIVELVVRDGDGWRIVALAFDTQLGANTPTLTLDQPKRGPLTNLLAEPDELDGELVDAGDLAVGVADARRELAPWRHRNAELSGAVEVHGASWAWAAGELEALDDRHAHLRVFAFATRHDGGSEPWHVVAVHAIAVAASADRE